MQYRPLRQARLGRSTATDSRSIAPTLGAVLGWCATDKLVSASVLHFVKTHSFAATPPSTFAAEIWRLHVQEAQILPDAGLQDLACVLAFPREARQLSRLGNGTATVLPVRLMQSEEQLLSQCKSIVARGVHA